MVFEGRDTAGKGGVIKRITERVSPRVFRVVALSAPTEREKSQMYFQRYVPHFPAAGEVVLFDRSWYNRAGVERVMGFATREQVESFLRSTPQVEKASAKTPAMAHKRQPGGAAQAVLPWGRPRAARRRRRRRRGVMRRGLLEALPRSRVPRGQRFPPRLCETALRQHSNPSQLQSGTWPL